MNPWEFGDWRDEKGKDSQKRDVRRWIRSSRDGLHFLLVVAPYPPRLWFCYIQWPQPFSESNYGTVSGVAFDNLDDAQRYCELEHQRQVERMKRLVP